ncbi:MAG: 16S rRNA (guanine(966)-N(2))-methyltransferase RsmD [Ilumatobacteraceae bacterium]
MAAATAVHTDDRRFRCQHTRSLARMRVTAGEFGGRRLVAPEGTTTRPTTDKVRQAVFNSLVSMGAIDGAVVADLFAGSGALGIEALSRGAERCVFVERDRAALHALRENISTLGIADRCTVHATDVMAWVPAMRNVDIAFIDPPYAFDGWTQLLPLVDVGLVVAEADDPVEAPEGWEQLRTRRYGRTWVTTLQRLA